ncbi:MAG TPA: hypothetical protein VFA45_08840 [Actinomycetes bacterium]|nr:hypothetical protein [Actinomycetes bacterium]
MTRARRLLGPLLLAVVFLGVGVAPAVGAPDREPPTDQRQAPAAPLPPPAQPVAPPSAQAKPGDQLTSAFENDQLPIDPSISRHPLSHYHVFYDEGGNNIFTKAPHLLQIAVGAATEAIFAFSAMLIGLAVWLLTWAFSFRFAAVLADPAARITESLQAQLIGPLSLLELAGLAAVVYMAWQFWKGQLAHGVGELAVSLLVIAIGSALAPAALLNDTMNLASQTAGAILVVGTGADPSTVPATSGQGYARQQYTRYFKAYGQTLVEQYVAVPSARLSWGTVPTGPCAAQLDKILTQGLDATDDKARDLMREGGPDCKRHADFAEHPSFWRLGGALANLLLALVIVAVVGVITGFLVAGQVGVALLIAFMRPALVVGVVPGWGRHLLHRWWTGFVKFGALAVAMSATLVFVVVTGRAVTDASATWPTPARLFAMVVVPVTAVMTAFRARRLSLRQTARLRTRMESAPTGGSHGAQILGRTTQAGMAGLMAANTLAAWREARFYGGKARASLFGGPGKDGWLLGAKTTGSASRGWTAEAAGAGARPEPLNVGPAEAGSTGAPGGAASGGEPASTKDQRTGHPKDSGKPVPKSLAAMAPRVKERSPEAPAHEPPHHERQRGSDRPAGTEGPAHAAGGATKTQQKTKPRRTSAAEPSTTAMTPTPVAPRRARPPARQPRARFAARAANSKAARLLGTGAKAGRAVGKAAFNVSLNGPRFGAEAAGRASVRAEAARDRVRTLLGRVDEATVRWYVETRYPSGTFQRARREAQRRRGRR